MKNTFLALILNFVINVVKTNIDNQFVICAKIKQDLAQNHFQFKRKTFTQMLN